MWDDIHYIKRKSFYYFGKNNMKRIYVNFVSILFIALSLVFTACNQGMTTGSETGTVWISIGGGAFRAVDPASGLPVFDETNTKITVTKEDLLLAIHCR